VPDPIVPARNLWLKTIRVSEAERMSLGFDLAAAKNWMLSMYDPSFGLFRAAPYAQPDCNNFWLYNDNHLVFSTLKYYCAVDTQFPTSRIVILDGQVVPYLRNPNAIATIEQRGNMFVKNEYTPQSGAPIPVGQYADIDFYDAINQFNFGHTVEAVNAFQQAERTFWDGIGFKDESFDGHYQLFKNCVYLIAARIIGVTGQYSIECQARIIAAQNFTYNRSNFPLQSGGVMTEYDPDLIPTGDTNLETTALACRCFE
jgi:hypothetical protein